MLRPHMRSRDACSENPENEGLSACPPTACLLHVAIRISAHPACGLGNILHHDSHQAKGTCAYRDYGNLARLGSSLRLDIGLSDNRSPLVGLGFEIGGEFGGRGGGNLHSLFAEFLYYGGDCECRD